MEVIALLFLLIFVVVVGFFAYAVFLFILNLLIRFLPAVMGLFIAVLLWRSGSDNLGAVVALGGFVSLIWWFEFSERFIFDKDADFFSDDGSPSWTAGKRKHYDTRGNIKGYSDRDD